jgi:drug/metabolite transporter (DMT)-like permease
MPRIQLTLALIASAIIMVFGVYLGLTKDDTEAAVMGWVLGVVGAVGLVANLVLRARMR